MVLSLNSENAEYNALSSCLYHSANDIVFFSSPPTITIFWNSGMYHQSLSLCPSHKPLISPQVLQP